MWTKRLSLIMLAMNSKVSGVILLICTKSAFSKSIRTNGFERSRILIHSHMWEMMSTTEQKPACLSILPSFAFWAVQIVPSNGLASGGPVREPCLHWPLPCRLRLCFVNLTSSYSETIALKVWVLKNVDNILGSTWVSGRLRPYPAWSYGRKPRWHVTSKADPFRRRASPWCGQFMGKSRIHPAEEHSSPHPSIKILYTGSLVSL